MRSRLAEVRQAERPALKARMMISGPAGAGKTLSGLTVASRLADGGRVLWIDTEKESALTYADEYKFEHLPWSPPYDPRELAATITEAGSSFDVIGIDSLSHFWRGTGGTLDMAAGKFTGWQVARPAQEDLVEAILNADAHVIVCVRSKMDHVQEVDPKSGKFVVKKLGMSPMQDDTLEYELNVSIEMDIEHRMAVSKSRTTSIPVGKVYQPGHAEDLADEYAAWLRSGVPVAATSVREQLAARLAVLSPEQQERVKADWLDEGLPALGRLPADAVETVEVFIERATAG